MMSTKNINTMTSLHYKIKKYNTTLRKINQKYFSISNYLKHIAIKFKKTKLNNQCLSENK
jgi:hypothetical protein